MRRSQLRRQSVKAKNKNSDRKIIVSKVLADSPYCVACKLWAEFDMYNNSLSSLVIHQNRSRDVHEILNRSQGGSILDELNLLAICRDCHFRVTTNPSDSAKLGLHVPAWCNTEEHLIEAARLRLSWMYGIPYVPEWV